MKLQCPIVYLEEVIVPIFYPVDITECRQSPIQEWENGLEIKIELKTLFCGLDPFFKLVDFDNKDLFKNVRSKLE